MILPLEHVLRDYDWGSASALHGLVGRTPDGSKLAELWLGAHPDSPAQLVTAPGATEPLDSWLAAHPAALGAAVLDRFGNRLPYLLKVLAADQALSLQVHPTAARAAEGFREENEAGVDPGARERRYKDPFHKPEMVVAVTDFQALCGLRPVEQTLALLQSLELVSPQAERLQQLLSEGEEASGLAAAFDFLLSPDLDVQPLVDELVAACRHRLDEDPIGDFHEVLSTVVKLSTDYPGDPGIVVALLLNRVTLAPGEALYLPAGNVHAYLAGTAVEVMATSDNVLRAGLTPKYVDVPELMSVVDFQPRPIPYVRPSGDSVVQHYRPGAAEFDLDWVEADDDQVTLEVGGPRILLILGGGFEVRSGAQQARVAQSESLFVTAEEGPLELTGTGTAVLVSVPGA